MELKDVILSTLAEMEDNEATKQVLSSSIKPKKIEIVKKTIDKEQHVELENSYESEIHFLNSFRERLLVLFEGFQAPNNVNIESKVDMTLNFLEYALAMIDDRVQKLDKGKLK